MKPFWIQVRGPVLAQGDLLPDCLIPVFTPEFGQGRPEEDVRVDEGDLIIVTQSCDLVSLPVAYVTGHAASLGERWRLDSPFLEHFSQAFARFFMRVGLPSSIPSYK